MSLSSLSPSVMWCVVIPQVFSSFDEKRSQFYHFAPSAFQKEKLFSHGQQISPQLFVKSPLVHKDVSQIFPMIFSILFCVLQLTTHHVKLMKACVLKICTLTDVFGPQGPELSHEVWKTNLSKRDLSQCSSAVWLHFCFLLDIRPQKDNRDHFLGLTFFKC